MGALVVIATLFYLARQIRLNREAVNRSNEYAVADSIHSINKYCFDVFSTLTTDQQLADIYTRATNGEPLDPTESTRFAQFVNLYLTYVEYVDEVQNLKLGYEVEDAVSIFDGSAPLLRKLLRTEAGAAWWEADAPSLYLEHTIQKVNRVLDDD